MYGLKKTLGPCLSFFSQFTYLKKKKSKVTCCWEFDHHCNGKKTEKIFALLIHFSSYFHHKNLYKTPKDLKFTKNKN
jgi:hypothetical protein